MLTTATITAATATNLRTIRHAWGDLLHAINTPPDADWPPRHNREWEQPAASPEDTAGRVGRLPLTLREYPAPLNTGALDAAISIETALFDLADQIAATVQRPVRRVPGARVHHRRTGTTTTMTMPDPADRDDPARWHHQTATGPGSRAYGLHWACVWVEGRVLGEDAADLLRPLGARLLDDAHSVTSRARATLERALNRDTRTTPLAATCPWCGSQLIGRNTGGDPAQATVTCTGGRTCAAPVTTDPHGRRVWQGPDLGGLYAALTAKHTKETAA